MIQSKFLIVVFFLLTFLSLESFSQKYLVFDKPGLVKRVRFQVGEPITVKYYNEERYGGVISNLEMDYLMIDNLYKLYLDSITHIKIYKQNNFSKFRKGLSSVLITVGIGYLAIDAFNNARNDRQAFDESNLTFSTIFIGSGLLLKLFQNRTYKLSNNKRLFVIDMGDD